MSDSKPTMSSTAKPKISRVEVYWHTVTYKTVALYVLLIGTIIGSATYLVFPETSASLVRRLSETITPHDTGVATISARQARFVNLDGKVQVKKVNSVTWENADYQLTLDKGDLIQTASEGVARIQFADGTTYTVKGDTLVTVEENLVEQDHASSVGVHISSGQVDLATGAWEVPGSKAEVSFENAVASLQANSRAVVRSDPETKQQEITVHPAAPVEPRQRALDIGQYERVTFPTGGAMTKSQVLAPPKLVQPLNLQPITVADPKHDPVHFGWNPVATAKSYEFQVSTTAAFNHVVVSKKTANESVDIAGLDPGDYFWRVRAIDADKINLSDESDSFKFILVIQGKEQEMLLEVDSTELQGNVVEVIGRTEPGAALIINGEQVAASSPTVISGIFCRPWPRATMKS